MVQAREQCDFTCMFSSSLWLMPKSSDLNIRDMVGYAMDLMEFADEATVIMRTGMGTSGGKLSWDES